MLCRRDVDIGIHAFGDDGLLEFAFVVKLEEITSAESKGHALVIKLKVIIDLCQHKGGQLSLGEGFIFVEGLTERAQLVNNRSRSRSELCWHQVHVHLTYRPSDFSPQSVDIIVQGLQGEDLELGLFVVEEAQDSGG